MSNQPETSEQQANTDTDKGKKEPQPTALKAEHAAEVTGKTDAQTQNAADKIQASPVILGRRVWNWIKAKASEASLADWAMVLFTLIIAISTIVYTVYAKRQWSVMSDQLAEMKRSG